MQNSYREYTYPNGEKKLGFTRIGCGVNTNFKQISKEEYDRYTSMSYGEVDKEIESGLSDAVRWGSGYYGFELYHDGEADLYFLGLKIGNSCE